MKTTMYRATAIAGAGAALMLVAGVGPAQAESASAVGGQGKITLTVFADWDRLSCDAWADPDGPGTTMSASFPVDENNSTTRVFNGLNADTYKVTWHCNRPNNTYYQGSSVATVTAPETQPNPQNPNPQNPNPNPPIWEQLLDPFGIPT